MESTGKQGTHEPGSVEAIPGPHALTLRVRGVIDPPAVRRLDVEIRRLVVADHPGTLVVDLSAVEYCDGGLLVLVDDVRRGVRGRFAVRGPDPEVLGTAESAGLREVFAAYRASVALAGTVREPVTAGRATAADAELARYCAALAVAVATPAGDVDVSLVAGRLVDRCADWFDVEAAVVVTVEGTVVTAASTEAARTLVVDGGDEGPVAGHLRTGRRAAVPDLAAPDPEWPSFARRALRQGVRAVHTLPLRPAPESPPIGVLVLLSRAAGAMSTDDLAVAAAFADLTATALAAARPVAARMPTGSAADRVMVEQASGMLAERHGIGLSEARVSLVRCARTRDLHLGEVARLVVSGDLQIGHPETR